MNLLQKIADKIKPHPKDVNGIDFGSTETRIVRVRKNGDALTLLGLDILPAIDFGAEDFPSVHFSVPLKIRANYAAISINAPQMSLKLLSIPGAPDPAFDQKIAKNLGLPEDTSDRLGYRIIAEGSGRAESRILAVGLPEPETSNCVSLFASGLPAPWRVEASPIATLTAFEAGPVRKDEHAIGLIDFNAKFCSFSIFHKKSLALLRRFDFGMDRIYSKITTSLNVDQNTAVHILADTAFDVTDLLHDTMQPLFSQIVLSRDFVERRENCSISTLFLNGALATSGAALNLMRQSLNTTVVAWDPFDIPSLSAASGLLDGYQNRHWRFGAALGAALATFEEDA
jgi:hypothetical protein